MLDSSAARSARAAIAADAVAGLGGPELLTRFIGSLQEAVPFDAAGICQVDPATLLATGGVSDGMPADTSAAYLDFEFLQRDYIKHTELVRAQRPAATLHVATGGDLERSPRHRRHFAPHGFGDELRIEFLADGVCWASGCLLRDGSRAPFSDAEARFVGSLTRHVAHGLRTATVALPPPGAPATEAPGIAMVDDAYRLLGLTGDAERWLGDLGWRGPEHPLPGAVCSVVARARGCRDGGASGPPRTRVRGASGLWISVHASAWPAGGWAVVLEAARPAEVLPLLCQAHGLTPREQEVMGLMLRGARDRDVAETLVISLHTAKEHARAVLRKMGVASRMELQATLLAEHYRPWLAATAA